MKQLLHFLTVFTFAITFCHLQAQSIAITDNLGNNIVGDTVFASGPAAYTFPGLHINLGEFVIVKNTSGLNKNIKVKRILLDAPPPTKNQFCWGVTCYPITTDESTNAQQLNAGGADSSFVGYFFPENTPGLYYIRYVFFVDGSLGDTAYFDAQIKAETQSVENFSDGFKLISAFPNPAGNYVYFDYQNTTGKNLNVNIFDMVGNRVKTVSLQTGAHKQRVNLSDLNSGIYFYSISGQSGKVLLTKRLVVTR